MKHKNKQRTNRNNYAVDIVFKKKEFRIILKIMIMTMMMIACRLYEAGAAAIQFYVKNEYFILNYLFNNHYIPFMKK